MNIVPGLRFIWCMLLLGIPCSTILVFDGVWPTVGLLGWLLLLGVSALDVIQSRSLFDEVEFDCPDVVRLALQREGALTIKLVGSYPEKAACRIAAQWSDALNVKTEEVRARWNVNTGAIPLTWDCSPLARGQYEVRELRLEHASRWALWNMRTRHSVKIVARVYPDLMHDAAAAAIFLRQNQLGTHAQRMLGRGREFEQLREYQFGDSFEDVDWKATARRARPITKTFQVERVQEIYVALDQSRLSKREVPALSRKTDGVAQEPLTVWERYLNAALLMGKAAENQGDQFGVPNV